MIVIVLAALGVPLWLLLGAVGAGLWSRRSFSRTPGVFAVKVRVLESGAPAPKWPRRASYARWVHDVLIVHKGVALVRNRALPVADVAPSTIGEVTGLGDDPVAVRLRLDSGEVVEVATASRHRDTLIGPFGDRVDTVSS